MLAAAALLADYILTAAVGISAGVGALVSAAPRLLPHTLAMCLVILLIITIVNLRGVKDAGTVFLLPTYLFVGTLLIVIVAGVIKYAMSGGHPQPVVAPPAPGPMTQAVTYWLLLRVFASGCTALTGVEAVSNGVKAFEEPRTKNAQKTLTVIIAILAVMLAGISFLVKVYGIAATDPGAPGYQSVLSMVIAAVFGKGAFYWVSIISILLVLSLSANTAFADFPRLCRSISQNNYLPHGFGQRGRRLVYGHGILVLAAMSAFLLFIFKGVTDRLIPLYAVGAFLAFTLSQAGMVHHWWKQKCSGWRRFAAVNAVGAFVTGVTVVVVLLAKFVEGAWITLIFIPAMILIFYKVRHHYHAVSMATRCSVPVEPYAPDKPPIAVVAMDRWSAITKRGLEFARRLSPNVIAVHVEVAEHSALLKEDWERYVVASYEEVGERPPELKTVSSPYRFVVLPIVEFVLKLAEEHPERKIVVVIPELVEDRWYEVFLHNQRARLLEWMLLAKGNERIYSVSAPYYVGLRSKVNEEEARKIAHNS